MKLQEFKEPHKQEQKVLNMKEKQDLEKQLESLKSQVKNAIRLSRNIKD